MTMSIGALAKASGVKVPTIRYYEATGLLPTAPRTDSNRRTYGADDARLLRFIRHARDLGFPVEDIRALIALKSEPTASCAEIDGIARHHLQEVERRIAQLDLLRAELQRMVAECSGGRVCECRVVEVLADHGQCRHEHGRAAQTGL